MKGRFARHVVIASAMLLAYWLGIVCKPRAQGRILAMSAVSFPVAGSNSKSHKATEQALPLVA